MKDDNRSAYSLRTHQTLTLINVHKNGGKSVCLNLPPRTRTKDYANERARRRSVFSDAFASHLHCLHSQHGDYSSCNGCSFVFMVQRKGKITTSVIKLNGHNSQESLSGQVCLGGETFKNTSASVHGQVEAQRRGERGRQEVTVARNKHNNLCCNGLALSVWFVATARTGGSSVSSPQAAL